MIFKRWCIESFFFFIRIIARWRDTKKERRRIFYSIMPRSCLLFFFNARKISLFLSLVLGLSLVWNRSIDFQSPVEVDSGKTRTSWESFSWVNEGNFEDFDLCVDVWLYANNQIGTRWVVSREKWESEKGNKHRQRWSMRFSRVNDNDFTLNTYLKHSE